MESLLLHFITRWGYLAVVAGTFAEGETVVLLAGVLAREGYLSFWGLCGAALLGSLAGDQLLFYLGRRYGKPFVDRRPRLQQRAERITRLLDRYETLCLVGFRFAYGLRSVAPVVFGAHGIAPGRFLLCNLCGGVLWALSFSAAGYGTGSLLHALDLGLARQHHALLAGALLLTLATAATLAFRRWRRPGRSGCQKTTVSGKP